MVCDVITWHFWVQWNVPGWYQKGLHVKMQFVAQRVWTADDDKDWHFNKYLYPLCAWERKRKRVAIRGQVIPYTGKTCFKDRKFLWVSIHKGFFKVISLWATGFAALLKFLCVQPAKARDVYTTPNFLPMPFPVHYLPPIATQLLQSLCSYRLPFLNMQHFQILSYI